MHEDWFKDLKVGDVIRNNRSGDTFVVNYAARLGFVVTRTITATNAREWTLIRKGIPALEAKED
jgi:hypothetical protein